MSAPALKMWLPFVFVQLLTNWNWSSFSVKGQLQRATPRPSPKLEIASAPPLLLGAPPSPVDASDPRMNEPKPAVLGSLVLALGIPKVVMGVPPSGLWV